MTTLYLKEMELETFTRELIAADIAAALTGAGISEADAIADVVQEARGETQTEATPETLLAAIDVYYDRLQEMYKKDFSEKAEFLEARRDLVKDLLFDLVEESDVRYLLQTDYYAGDFSEPKWCLYKQYWDDEENQWEDFDKEDGGELWGYWQGIYDEIGYDGEEPMSDEQIEAAWKIFDEQLKEELGFLPYYQC